MLDDNDASMGIIEGEENPINLQSERREVRGEDAGGEGAGGKEAGGKDERCKDANDLLQLWVREGKSAEEQRAIIKGMMEASQTMVEMAAEWAAGKNGGEKDDAQRTVFRLVGMLTKVEKAQYKTKLMKKLGVGVREFNETLNEIKAEDKGKDGEAIATLGGLIHGWLVEYMYNPLVDEARLAYRDPDRKIGVAKELVIEDVKYIPVTPGTFIRDGGVIFAGDLGPLKPTRELVAIVEAFIHKNYMLENRYLGRIITYYVLMTWLFDCFNALPYLRSIGEAGAGKSELMKRVGHLCYRLMMASGANTSASFFRATEQYKGTVFIDEADLHDGGDMSNDLVKFLNLGAMKGNPIWRLEETYKPDGTKTYEVATFSTFCPKLIAMRKEFRDDAVGSRSLTIKLQPREPMELKARGIRLYIDDEFRAQALVIRNLLLRWRLEHWQAEIPVTEDLMDLEISSRLNQVTMPLKALAQDDYELMEEIETFLRAYNRDMVLTRSMTIAARVVEAIWKMYKAPDLRMTNMFKTSEGEEYMMIGDVRTVANEIMDEMNRGPEEEEEDEKDRRKRKGSELTARGVGHIIRNELQLKVGERRGSGFPVFWDEMKMMGLAKRYGVAIPEYKSLNGDGEGEGQENREGAKGAKESDQKLTLL